MLQDELHTIAIRKWYNKFSIIQIFKIKFYRVCDINRVIKIFQILERFDI